MKIVQSAARTYRQDGFRSLLTSAYGYTRWQLAKKGLIQGVPYHQRKRTDSEDRWLLVASQLDSADTTALDIGCASGFLARN